MVSGEVAVAIGTALLVCVPLLLMEFLTHSSGQGSSLERNRSWPGRQNVSYNQDVNIWLWV